jgi:hypothetical protein
LSFCSDDFTQHQVPACLHGLILSTPSNFFTLFLRILRWAKKEEGDAEKWEEATSKRKGMG